MNQPDPAASNSVQTPGQFLCSHRDRIVRMWLERVRLEVSAAKGHADDALIDNLPNYLDSMAGLLETPEDPSHMDDLEKYCRIHAEQRSRLAPYSLLDVVTEHHILRNICFSELTQNVALSTEQGRLASDAIFRGVIASTALFSALLIKKHESAIRNLEAERENREHLVTSLTHDLRQPLQIIRINAQILQRESDRDKQFRFINKIIEHSERAASMLDDLLDANRLRAGEKLRLNLEEIDLQQLISHICGDMSTSYGERFNCVTGPPVLGTWDAAKLRRAIENLLVNAVKYGWQHTPITLSIKDYGQNVECSVHNHGEPIPADQIELIFDQYYRGPVARRTGSKGWGVGLALVKGITEAHGGTVCASSSEQQGTTFTLTLPKAAPNHSPNNHGT